MNWRALRACSLVTVVLLLLILSGCLSRWDRTPPVAVATAAPTSGPAPLAVSLDGSLSTSQSQRIVQYRWDFGDGATATGIRTTHTFTVLGDYTVTLTVTDSVGQTSQAAASIVVTEATPNAPPHADIAAEPYIGEAPLNVAFDGSGSFDPDGTIVAYTWDFGDSWSGTGVRVTHTYLSPGWYTASLTVEDNAGAKTMSTVITLCQGHCGG